MIYSINLLFLMLLTFSTMIVVSSPSWFCMWLGIEMNTMAFIPIMYQFNNKLPTESALKYFLTQTFASLIMFLSIILMMSMDFYSMFTYSNMMLLAMGIKAGVAPFHMWYPPVVEGLSWNQNLILMTWQKIAPLTIMSTVQSTLLNMIMTISSLLIGPISAFNQSSLRKIMAYSSITHMSWMIIMMYNKTISWINYMLIYFTTTTIMMILLNTLNIKHILQMNSLPSTDMYMLAINLLSMGGFPPFLGFMGKWLILNELMNNNMIMISLFLVISSCMNLYIYMRIIHSPMHLESTKPKMNTKSKTSSMHIPPLTLMSLFLSPIILLM